MRFSKFRHKRQAIATRCQYQNDETNNIACLPAYFTLAKAQTIDTLMDVGGHKLHFHVIQGKGTPVLFEAGNGDGGSAWQPILDTIHKAAGVALLMTDTL